MSIPQIPDTIRSLLKISGTDKGISQIEAEYRIWIFLTLGGILAGILSLTCSIYVETDSLLHTRLLKLVLLLVCCIDFILSYFLYQETRRRHKYLLELKKILDSSESVRKTIFNIFKR